MQRLIPIQEFARQRTQRLHQSLSHTATDLYRYVRNSSVSYALVENLSAIKQGVVSFFPLKKLENLLYHSTETRSVLMQSLHENILYYAAPVVLYHGMIKPLLQTYCYEEDEMTDQVVNGLANVFFMRCALALFVKNTSYALCLNQAADTALMEQRKGMGCECPSIEKVKANIVSGIYYLENMAIANAMKYVPYVGQPLQLGISSLALGQCLVEYDFASKGMCTTHRIKAFSKNNAYCFGVGLAFFMVLQFLCSGLARLVKTENGFTEDVFFSLLFQYGILIGLMQSETLPDKGVDKDFFRYPRVVANALLAEGYNQLVPHLSNQNKRGRFQDMFSKVVHFPLVNLPAKLILPKEFFHLHDFVKVPAISLFVEMKQKSVIQALDAILTARGYPLWVADYLPSFFTTHNTRIILKILNEKGWEHTVAYIKEMMTISLRSREPSEALQQNVTDRILLDETYLLKQEDEIAVSMHQTDALEGVDLHYFAPVSSPLRRHNLFQVAESEAKTEVEAKAEAEVTSVVLQAAPLTDSLQVAQYF